MKLAIVGSRAYENDRRVRTVIEKARDRYKDDLVVVSGGCPNGGDKLAKDICLEMGIKYVEFPPAHAKFNKYCIKSSDCYNKPYNVGNFFSRNTEIAEYCDKLIGFVVSGVKANGTLDTVHKAAKLSKPTTVFYD